MTCTDVNSDVTGICRDAQIWEPNDTAHVQNAINWYNTSCLKRTGATVTEKSSYVMATKTDDAPTNCGRVYNGTAYSTYAVSRDILIGDNVDVYDGSYNTYTGTADTLLKQVDTFTDSEKLQTGAARLPFMTLAPNSITKVRVYIWIEGQDIDNYDFASLGNSIKVNFGFTKERFTSGEIGSGINPGSGVKNQRKELSEQTLGIPVIALGVPTVVDSVTITHDIIEYVFRHLQDINEEKLFGEFGKLDESNKRMLIEGILEPNGINMMVTPKEIDSEIEELTKIIANGLDLALHPGLYNGMSE